MKNNKVIISVTSDLATDQRVHRTAMTLSKAGLEVILVGRIKKDSLPVNRPYRTVRFKLWFEKGFLFYAEYTIVLFFYLLFHKADVLVANDLDTLMPNYLISRLKKSQLYYDSHEYFTGVPELVNRPRVQRIWKKIEQWIFPKLKHIYTVNDSIVELYSKEYHRPVEVIRNIPISVNNPRRKTRAELNMPADKKILLLQGAGINIQRGAEEAVEMMQYLDDALLLIIGSGDVIDELKRMVEQLRLEDHVRFIPKLPLDELQAYTQVADIGLTLDKPTSPNYRFSLPNKLFDYIYAGLPVLASNLVEVRKIVEEYDIGLIADDHDPRHLAAKVKEMFADEKRFAVWKENLKLATTQLCWEKEELKLLKIFNGVIGQAS